MARGKITVDRKRWQEDGNGRASGWRSQKHAGLEAGFSKPFFFLITDKKKSGVYMRLFTGQEQQESVNQLNIVNIVLHVTVICYIYPSLSLSYI